MNNWLCKTIWEIVKQSSFEIFLKIENKTVFYFENKNVTFKILFGTKLQLSDRRISYCVVLHLGLGSIDLQSTLNDAELKCSNTNNVWTISYWLNIYRHLQHWTSESLAPVKKIFVSFITWKEECCQLHYSAKFNSEK